MHRTLQNSIPRREGFLRPPSTYCIRFCFYKGPCSLYGRIIKFWTSGPYSHCGVWLPGGDFLESIEPQGVVSSCKGLLDTSQWDTLTYAVSCADIERIRKLEIEELGCGYDYMGVIFAQALHIPREHPDKWFCSELTAAIARVCNIRCVTKPSYHYSPNDLARLLNTYLRS